jgi:hypothetical protein
MHRLTEVSIHNDGIENLNKSRSDIGAVLIAIAIFASLSIWGAITSTGFLEADSCTHYMYARAAFTHPHFFVNVWGRPICTMLYAAPAYFTGRIGVRFTSLLTALGIGLIARQIAKGQGWRWPVLALVFTLAQPLVFLHSFSELTELPFALLLALGFWAYQRKRWFWMAVVIGLTPLSRPEGFGFLVLAAIALIVHRRWWWLVMLALPLVIWDYAGWRLYGRPGAWWGWLAANWPYAEQSLYQPGLLLHFVLVMPIIASPFIFPATVLGIWRCLNGRGSLVRSFMRNHRRRCEILIAAIPLLILVVHSLLYWRGKMASNGEIRYMLVVAPFWGLLSARGWTWVFDRLNWNYSLQWAAVAAVLPLAVNLYYRVLPLIPGPDWVEAQQIATWYADSQRNAGYPYLATSHPGILYYLNSSPANAGVVEWRKNIIDAHPAGTIVVWDPTYGVFNADESRSISLDEMDKAGWKSVAMPWSGDKSAGKWRVFESAPIARN